MLLLEDKRAIIEDSKANSANTIEFSPINVNEIAQITCGLAQKYVKNGIYKKAKTYAARSLEVSEQIKIDNLKANAFPAFYFLRNREPGA